MHPGNDALSQPRPAFRAPDQPVPKICGVCGERAKSHHFGGMACDSCKAFFRRSVQSEAYKHFRCSYDGCCHITISSRKCCQSCRFQKCLKIGMEKKWVMSEEERIHQDKIRKDRKRQRKEEEESRKCRLATPSSGGLPTARESSFHISDEDRSEIDNLVKKFYDSYSLVPLEPEIPEDTRPPPATRVAGVFVNAVSRLVSFIATLPHFQEVHPADQKILLKNGVLAVLILRGTMVYDTGSSLFNAKAVGAKVGISDLKSVLTPELMENHQKFVERVQSLRLDKTANMLLQMVVMFSSDLPGLQDSDTVSRLQDHYTCLIRRYMSWVRGEESTRVLYPRTLHLLADLRALVEAHNMNTVCFPDNDMANVVTKFSKIELNPYPMWPEFSTEQSQDHHEAHHHQQQLHQHHQQQQLQQQQQQQHLRQQQRQQRQQQHQQQNHTQMMSWRRSGQTNCVSPAAGHSVGSCVRPRLDSTSWPGICPPHTPTSTIHRCSRAVAGTGPHCPQLVHAASGSPQSPGFHATERLLPPTGAQCISASPPAGPQYSVAAQPPAGYQPTYTAPGCSSQTDSPSPGTVPAQWQQWAADGFATAGVGPFAGELGQPRPPPAPTDCLRLPPGGDPANHQPADLDVHAILDWLLAEMGPALQASKMASNAWSQSPAAGFLQQHHPHHQHHQQHQQHLQQQLNPHQHPPQPQYQQPLQLPHQQQHQQQLLLHQPPRQFLADRPRARLGGESLQ